VLVDTKYRDFPLATGLRKAGDPVHEMVLIVTIDSRTNILAAHAESNGPLSGPLRRDRP